LWSRLRRTELRRGKATAPRRLNRAAWRLAFLAVTLGSVAAGCGGGGKAAPASTYELAAAARPGARLFFENGCPGCHTYLGAGNRVAGSPDLTDEGTKGRGVSFQIAHLKCPSCLSPGSPMPSYASLGMARLRQLAVFLEASKGGR
jgi:mono/diheme cytochrome c family protein